MDELLNADIFFIIASVATVLFCVFICVILFQVYKIVTIVRKLITRFEAGSEGIADDVAYVRSKMRGGVSSLFSMFTGFGSPRASKKRKESSIIENEE